MQHCPGLPQGSQFTSGMTKFNLSCKLLKVCCSPVGWDEKQLSRLQHHCEAPDISEFGPCISVRAVKGRHCIAIIRVLDRKGIHPMMGMLWSNQQDAPAPAHLHRIRAVITPCNDCARQHFPDCPEKAWHTRHMCGAFQMGTLWLIHHCTPAPLTCT